MISFKYPHSIAFNHAAAMGILASPAHQEIMADGYATTVVDSVKYDYLVLGFQNVEDHVDGHGLATVIMLYGEGSFYYDGQPTKMQTGDIVHFSEHIEHGFESDQTCIALVINWDQIRPTQSEIITRIEQLLLDLNQVL